jgi:hypothetical protein
MMNFDNSTTIDPHLNNVSVISGQNSSTLLQPK